jgi:hypothetical protein
LWSKSTAKFLDAPSSLLSASFVVVVRRRSSLFVVVAVYSAEDTSGVRSVDLTPAPAPAPAMAGSSVSADPEELTLDNVRDGKVKLNVLKKVQLLELCNTFIGHISRLEFELEKNKAPHNVSTSNETFELRAELKELKEAVFIDATGTNACGDVPVGLTQEYWDTGNRRVISWDTIHNLAAEQDGTKDEKPTGASASAAATLSAETAASEFDGAEPSGAVAAAEFKTVKRKKRTTKATSAGTARSTDRRPVCPVMLSGTRCAGCTGSKHPRSCVEHTSANRPKSCKLWHWRMLLATSNQGRGTMGSSRSGGNPTESKLLQKKTDQIERLKKHVVLVESQKATSMASQPIWPLAQPGSRATSPPTWPPAWTRPPPPPPPLLVGQGPLEQGQLVQLIQQLTQLTAR